MRLFFKHIVRTVRSSPLQPMLVLLTLILSVAIGITALKISMVFFERADDQSSKDAVLGDITVTASLDRDIGIIFDTDVKEILGNTAEVLGEFELSALVISEEGSRVVRASAIDLCEADEYFSFKYYEYGSFTEENIENSILISKSFADKNGLSVGDSVTVSLLDEKLVLSVQAIAENEGLLAQKDILFPMERVLRLLSGRSAFIASLGTDFVPYNKLMIKCSSGYDAVETARLLSEHEKMQGSLVELTDENKNVNPFAMFQAITVSLLAFVLLLLSVLLMLTSQSLMRQQRSFEYAQFSAAGASSRNLAVMQLLENLTYAIIGATVGILLSPFILSYMLARFDWTDYEARIGLDGILFGYALALILAILVTLISVKKDEKKELALKLNESNYPTAPRTSAVPAAVFGCISLISLVISCFLHINIRYLTLIVSTISSVVLIYFASPHLYTVLMKFIDKALEKRKSGSGVFAIAVKSIKNNYSLRHTGRLLCVVFSLVFTISLPAATFSSQYDVFAGMIEGEVMTTRMNDKVESQLKKDCGVEGVAQIEFNTVTVNGDYTVTSISFFGDVDECVSEKFIPSPMPRPGEVVISYGASKLLGVKEGDTVSVDVRGNTKLMKVSGIWNINVGTICIGEPLSAPNSRVYNVKLSEGNVADSARATVAYIETQGIEVLEDNDVIGIMDTMGGFDALITAVVILTVVLSFAGIANVVWECIRSRKRERELLIQSGLEPRGAIALHAIEFGVIIVIAAAVGIICGFSICMMLHHLVHSFGYTLFYF